MKPLNLHSLLFLLTLPSLIPAASPPKKYHPPATKTFTSLTAPLPLHPGQITNTWHRIPLPQGPIAVYSFTADIVELDKRGKPQPVALSDAYLHHHVIKSNHSESVSELTQKSKQRNKKQHAAALFSTTIRNVGFGAGTESRHTPQVFPYPYAFVTAPAETEWWANVHVINTRGMERSVAYHCLECPCDPSKNLTDYLNKERGWDHCNAALLKENNTACRAETYIGGLRCCEDGDYCLPPPAGDVKGAISTYYLRYVLTYSHITTDIQPLELAACCDASGDLTKEGNIEYDIPQCDEPGCVHTLSTIQELHGMADTNSFSQEFNDTESVEEKMVEVVYAVGHLHRGGLSVSLYDEVSGELLCNSLPTYGKGTGVGDEVGYIVAMSACNFDPPLQRSTMHPLRIVSVYNATAGHTGVMSLFYIAIAESKEGDVAALKEMQQYERHNGTEGFMKRTWSFFTFAVFGGVVYLGVKYFIRRKEHYSPIVSMNF